MPCKTYSLGDYTPMTRRHHLALAQLTLPLAQVIMHGSRIHNYHMMVNPRSPTSLLVTLPFPLLRFITEESEFRMLSSKIQCWLLRSNQNLIGKDSSGMSTEKNSTHSHSALITLTLNNNIQKQEIKYIPLTIWRWWWGCRKGCQSLPKYSEGGSELG